MMIVYVRALSIKTVSLYDIDDTDTDSSIVKKEKFSFWHFCKSTSSSTGAMVWLRTGLVPCKHSPPTAQMDVNEEVPHHFFRRTHLPLGEDPV